MAWGSFLAVLAAWRWSLSYAEVSVSEAFPGGVSGTSTASVMCRTGYSVGGGATDALKRSSYIDLAPCRLFCECVGSDGSCNYCCKYTAGTGCSRHKALYSISGVNKCMECYQPSVQDAEGATLTFHASGVMGRVGTSSVDASKQWISRGTNYIVDIVKNSNDMGFSYSDGFVACWGLSTDSIPVGWGTNEITCPTSQSAYPSTEDTAVVAPVHTATDYVPPDDELSPILNQGGCGNCYIQSAMAIVTDRILKQADSSVRTTMKNNAVSYSTGHVTRCHYNPDAGDACNGGQSKNVFKQMTGQSASSKLPALQDGLVQCTGGVYGGPTVTTSHPANTPHYYSQWAYGCVSGCKPFQSGFAGPPVPSGATCPAGEWTTDADTLYNALLPDANAVTEASGSNVNQFIQACGCPGIVQSTGVCQVCCAKHAGGTTYTIGGVSASDCSWSRLTSIGYGMGPESSWTNFGKSGESIMAWNGVSLHSKFYALSTCGCPAPTVTYTQGGTCTKCCLPKTGSKPGYQYLPKDKAAQPPAQCSGSGVTAGSTPGAAACTIPTCANNCEDSSNWPNPKVVMDDAPKSVYDPIGVAGHQPKVWNPMNELFIKDEIAQYGPVEAGFRVPNNFGSFFQSSKSGVFVSTANQATHGGHSVAIVGWGSAGAQKYWLVRNSWGREFAHGGFFKIEIGGHSAGPNVKFATASFAGIGAIAPFFKSGSARRLRKKTAESRRLNLIKNQNIITTNASADGGALETCSGAHQAEIDKLRTWFLANASNYNGVKGNCSVPWTYISHAMCTAKIVQGLHVHTTLHLEDCDNELYHWHVRWIWKHQSGDINDAIVSLSDGPHLQVAPENGTHSNNLSNPNGTVENANSAYMSCRAIAAAMVLLNCIFSDAF